MEQSATKVVPYGDAFRLVLFSFLMLFVELALIRWLGSNILYLSYFSNFVLLGSFLGIGVGFLHSKTSTFYQYSPLLLALLILFVSVFPVRLTFEGTALNNLLLGHLRGQTGFPMWVTLPIIFLAVTIVMASIAHGVAILFDKFKPLTAYRFDILGAMGGIIVFSLLSYINALPVVWGGIVVVTFIALFYKEWKNSDFKLIQIGALLLFFIPLALESISVNQAWSPYYKISLYKHTATILGDFEDVWVNGIPFQRMETLTRKKITQPFYFIPYEYRASHTPPEKVLIIGAGTGSDVAVALSQGAKHIDAVEIDPMIYKVGYGLNPSQPYQDPRVHVFINDGRAFLQQHHDRYDLILFALPDSLTLLSGKSSLRLESYLFTEEAIQSARNHLKPDGVFSMYNYYWQAWLVDRLTNTLKMTFNQMPCVKTYGEQYDWRTVLVTSQTQSALQCSAASVPLSGKWVAPVTDDHPFLYLQYNKIPKMYLIVIFLILATTLCVIRFTAGTLSAIKSYPDFFFMGMAFLLLETKSIAVFSLLFGITWMVNALVFAGILLSVYLAIETTNRFKLISSGYLYGMLLFMLAVGWIVPIHSLLFLPAIERFIVAMILFFSPIYLANLIFTECFQYSAQSTAAFGINMMGAMMGGLLEYVALITGYRFLLIIIALFYTIAFLVGKRRLANAFADELPGST